MTKPYRRSEGTGGADRHRRAGLRGAHPSGNAPYTPVLTGHSAAAGGAGALSFHAMPNPVHLCAALGRVAWETAHAPPAPLCSVPTGRRGDPFLRLALPSQPSAVSVQPTSQVCSPRAQSSGLQQEPTRRWAGCPRTHRRFYVCPRGEGLTSPVHVRDLPLGVMCSPTTCPVPVHTSECKAELKAARTGMWFRKRFDELNSET